MTLVDVLDGDTRTTSWRHADGEVECVVDGDVVGSVSGAEAALGDQELQWVPGRGYAAIVDRGTGARLATVRRRSHGPTAVEAGSGRYRIVRDGLKFWSRIVTEDIGGTPLARATRIGSTVRVEKLHDGVPSWDLALVTLALVHDWFGLAPAEAPTTSG